jgi:hypothetical protein
MAEHLLPPVICASNIPTWTDPVITASVTKPRKPHIDELRAALNAEFVRRGKDIASFTDPTLIASVTKPRKIHIDELRAECQSCKIGRSETGYCPQDASGCMDFTDPVITASVTKRRKPHIDELRAKIQALMTTCICEIEQCQYCSDCGFYYQTCSHAGVACDDHKYSECMYTLVNHYVCGSVNLAASTANPYKAASGDPISATAWDGRVPWTMCNYAPPGSNWGTCEYQGGHNHNTWNCKCNPFLWP